ncbi:hypothetical protein K470DRAFT_264509 [Piedraia hortae CBS 480.64]|uniref:Uncharacterized protein n=1 Tax=Piedraia hortae CBS 480.64 TaxID=1314780 RepID=A0A6A7C0C1_9PEZI|nr:hypothetical protein K470DRAFT_264509 [Piedraia hortae CBS 480.64]
MPISTDDMDSDSSFTELTSASSDSSLTEFVCSENERAPVPLPNVHAGPRTRNRAREDWRISHVQQHNRLRDMRLRTEQLLRDHPPSSVTESFERVRGQTPPGSREIMALPQFRYLPPWELTLAMIDQDPPAAEPDNAQESGTPAFVDIHDAAEISKADKLASPNADTDKVASSSANVTQEKVPTMQADAQEPTKKGKKRRRVAEPSAEPRPKRSRAKVVAPGLMDSDRARLTHRWHLSPWTTD